SRPGRLGTPFRRPVEPPAARSRICDRRGRFDDGGPVRRVLLATLFGMVISALTACGMSGGDSAQADSTASQADIQFSQQMIPHHQQSIQLAGLATQRGLSDFVKSMAGEITTKETAE